MSENTATSTELVTKGMLVAIDKLDLESLKTKLSVWVTKSNAAVAALQNFKAVNSDEDDEKAEKLLVKVRNTYNLINEERLTFTKPLDELKTSIMESENSIDPKKEGPYTRVKKLRDSWARQKMEAAKKIQDDARKEQARRDELTRLKALLETRFLENVLNAVTALESSLAAWMQRITLNTYESSVQALNVKPIIKPDVFESWFVVRYDASILSQQELNDFIAQVRAQYTYESINEKYQVQAAQTVEDYKKRLPGLKTRLEEIAKLDKAKQDEANAALLQQQQAQANERKTALEQNTAQQIELVNQNAAGEKLDSAFDATVLIQTADTSIKGTRTAKIATVTAPREEIIVVFSKLLYACAVNPKFEGYIKKDASGADKVDETGRPVYADWLEPLLKFYAANCSDANPIPGIEIKDVISTIQGGRK